MVSVGERTHRYFMLFLLTNIIASTYYSFGLFFYLKYFIGSALDHVYWSDSKFENFFYAFIVIFQTSPIVLGIFSVLVIITVSLLSFFVQQFYYISVNRTTIELGKIAKVKLQHKLAKYDEPYKHFYDHGFIQNWKEFLFPEKVEEHEPVYFKDDHDFEQFLKNQNKLQKGKNSGDESMKLKKA